jgi:hypothetical protein
LQHKGTSYETTLPYLTLPYLTSLRNSIQALGAVGTSIKRATLALIFLVNVPLAKAQWENTCIAVEPFNGIVGFVVAYINNLTPDCMSNDWVIVFQYPDGSISERTSEQWAWEMPGSQGWYDFNQLFWQCCDLLPFGGNGFQPNPMDLCPCEWEINSSGELVIDCSGC